ncbi:MAG: hypothetical protein CVV42_10045 [Candidatus Riflebacteria bacterium HGW-Riflebacteria-2]|jgi:hypothetical protein|nr:MAG: hypothetical protein CVV42_10045 [Candidatus Riflebacteria bacterium HGW-Riflebacteria-2]
MTNAFEFIPANSLKLRQPRLSLAFFLVTATCFLLGIFAMNKYTESLEQSYQETSARLEKETMTFIQRATNMLPDSSALDSVINRTRLHNLAIGGKNSVWTKLFNTLDLALPEDSVILTINNPKSGKAVFAAEDRQFRIRIALTGIEAANDIYARLASLQEIESLSFTPRGEMKQEGRQSLNVDLEFNFNETYATTP